MCSHTNHQKRKIIRNQSVFPDTSCSINVCKNLVPQRMYGESDKYRMCRQNCPVRRGRMLLGNLRTSGFLGVLYKNVFSRDPLDSTSTNTPKILLKRETSLRNRFRIYFADCSCCVVSHLARFVHNMCYYFVVGFNAKSFQIRMSVIIRG